MPTYTSQPDETNSNDSFLRNDSKQDTNYGTYDRLFIGSENPDYYKNRIVIKFDLSSIPSSAIITSATLSLYMTLENSNYARTINIYRLLQSWVESQVTWNSRYTGALWGSGGADATGVDVNWAVVGTRNFSTTEAVGAKDWNLDTSIIQSFINGTYTNHGFLIISTSENDLNEQWTFASSTNGTPTYRPKLVIEYNVPLGGSQTIWFG